MILAIPSTHAAQAVSLLNELGETAFLMGEIANGTAQQAVRIA